MKTEIDDNLLPLKSPRSVNNRIIVETYIKKALQSEVKNGFAMIAQKVRLHGLKVLVDAKLADGTFVPRGSTAFIKEESLHASAWAKNFLQCDTLPGQFLIVDISNVEFIAPPEELPAA